MYKIEGINKYLYHYTSIEALVNIIETSTIRLSDYRFLNDPLDIKFGFRMMLDAFNNYSNKNKFNIYKQAIGKYIKNKRFNSVYSKSNSLDFSNIILDEDLYFYVLSLTHNSDYLPMWNSYATNGVCIKFDKKILTDYFTHIKDSLLSSSVLRVIEGNVEYGDSYKDFVLLSEECLDELPNYGSKFSDLDVQNSILQYASKIKKSSWKFELEYKIGLPISGTILNNLVKGNRINFLNNVKGTVIKPQVEFTDLPKKAIKEIMVSPYCSSALTISGIENLLHLYRADHIKVSKSKINVR